MQILSHYLILSLKLKAVLNLLARLKSEGSQIQIKLVSRDKMKSSSRGAYFDPETKTIFLERGSELGLLGPYFVHELTHALDTANIKAFAACEQVKNLHNHSRL